MSYYFFSGPLGSSAAFPSTADQLAAQFFDLYKTHYDYLHTKFMQAELYGTKDPGLYYDKTNDFNYLLLYLMVIWLEKQAADEAAGCRSSVVTWRATYKLDCIANYFKCLGVDIERIYNIFGLSNDDTGIGNMVIEETNACEQPVFQIK